MNCEEIEEALMDVVGYECRYIGCYVSSDIERIYKKIGEKPIVFIINTLDEEGAAIDEVGHWITVYVDRRYKETNIAILDSFGINDLNLYGPYFKRFLSYFDEEYILTTFISQIQNGNTFLCGMYCIYFVHKLTRMGFSPAIERFAVDLSYGAYKANDEFIVRYGYNNFTLPQCQRVFCLEDTAKDKKDCVKLCNKYDV